MCAKHFEVIKWGIIIGLNYSHENKQNQPKYTKTTWQSRFNKKITSEHRMSGTSCT